MNKSEILFEEYCARGGIAYRPVLTTEYKTPDYIVTLGGVEVVVEVKGFTANGEEDRAALEFEKNRVAVWGGGKPGRRIRAKIEQAKRQLEAGSAAGTPAVLVLVDERPEAVKGIWPYEILIAMYGLESIDLHVPENMSKPVRFGLRRFGRDGKLRLDAHTYISAIGVLRCKRREAGCEVDLHLDVYLNAYASNPVPLSSMTCRDDITAFGIADGLGDQFRRWFRIPRDDELTE